MNFEDGLISKGYKGFHLNISKKDWRFEKVEHFSTMGDIDHRYFHVTNPNYDKISSGEIVTVEDRVGEIIYGLHECDKPPTLIYPRPQINGLSNYGDDLMNQALLTFTFDEIFNAMFDKSINLIL